MGRMISIHDHVRVPFALLIVLFVCVGCLNTSAEPETVVEPPVLPDDAITLPTATSEPTPAPEPELPGWLISLQESESPAQAPPGIFFLNGPDAWLINDELSVEPVTERQRIAAVATVPGERSAALIVLDTAGGRETEEIRIVDSEGNEIETLYGPEITGQPGGNPRVKQLRWSPDGSVLAIVREDDTLWLARSGESVTQLETPTETPTETPNIEALRWSPSGQAIVALYRPDNRAGVLAIVPVDGGALFTIDPLGSFGTVEWPAQSGSLFVVEDNENGANPNAGSIFRIDPVSGERELVVSAGEFGPAVRVSQTLASPDGTQIAFALETPGQDGEFVFQSLNVLDLNSRINRRINVSPGYAVSELWWFERGLVWRATAEEEGAVYTGVEAFIIETIDDETGSLLRIYVSDGA